MTTKNKPKINDLIFKELIKRGHSLQGNSKIWNISDSKLWYLTPEQAQGYLDLESSEGYRKEIIQKEVNLINENIKEIIDKIGTNNLNIIDIGCGDGKKAALFVKHLKGKISLRYCPIDISSYMVKKAIENVKKVDAGEIVKFQWNISDFENLKNISALLREGKFKKNLFLLLGNTLGNFEINELLHQIRSSMKSGDFLLIGNGIDNGNSKKMLDTYNSPYFNKFSICPLLEIGLKEKDVKFGVRFKNSRIESFYTIRKNKKVSFLEKSVNFKVGDEIIVIVSYKYTKEDILGFLNLYFDDVLAKFSKNESYTLGLCKK